MQLLRLARPIIKRSYWATCAAIYLRNRLDLKRFRAGDIHTDSGTPHSMLGADQSADYIEEVVRDYKTYGGVSRFGGRVAEIGPGDNCGVGLLLLADGCDEVDLADRFYSRRNSTIQAEIYRRLMDRSEGVADLLRKANLEDERTFPGIRRFYGVGAAAEEFFSTHGGYDFILSRAVGEHLYDPIAAMTAMATALNPNGVIMHKIDLRDHEMFSDYHHELKWLEVPDWLYSRMTRGSGRPNRVLAHQYERALESLQVESRLLVTRLVNVGDVVPHRPYDEIDPELRRRAESYVERHRHRFAPELRAVPAASLAISGLFLVARKIA